MNFRMGRSVAVPLALALATVLAGCQFPGFETPRQQASLPVPPKPAGPPPARGIWIVGAPSVEPRVRAVSARYEATPDTQPNVQAGGTVAGFRTLCSGTGVEHPDMVLSDRTIRAEELKRCAARGITLTEYQFGPKQFAYVKDAHMMAIPGVRDFVESWSLQGKPVAPPTTAS